MQGQTSSRLHITAIAFVTALALGNSGFAQTVTWGVNGAGGSGNWDTTTPDWYNGTTNVPWPSSGNAIFAGASGGTVDVPSTVVVSSMTFNTPGYSVFASGSGVINGGSGGLTVTTNANTTIDAFLDYTAPNPGNILTKNGSATLTLTGATFIPIVNVNQGELDLSGSGTLFFSNVNLANASGVVVTLDPNDVSSDIGSLTGGGLTGGLVQPVDKPQTVTLNLFDGGSFGGTLADNGTGILALNYNGNNVQTLTGMNTYSGPTTIESGALKLSGNGSITSTTSINIAPGTTLELDDSGTAIGNRLSLTAPISINGGTLRLDGNATTSANENAGQLRVAGASQLTANPDPSPLEQLSFAGLTREGYGVLSIIGSNVSFAGLTNGSTGIVAPYITVVNDWGTVGADGRITAFTAYVPDINAASATDNVRIISSGTTTLAAPSTVGSLNLQSAGTINPTLDLGGHELGLTTGGIITSTGVGTNVIRNGSLSTPSGEFVVTTYSSGLTINANIVDSGGGTALTKSGTSMLTLTGNNTYTGLTSIMQGTLAVSSDANLGLGTTINFGGGTLLAAGSFMSAKGIDTVSNGGTINTAGFNLEFTGPSSGSLTKTGLGTLTLDNAMTDSLTIQQGLVVLPHGAASSVVNLIGANLQVAGAIEGLTWQPILSTHPISTLDIGGPAAAALTMVQFSLVGGSPVQVNFGLGSTHSDSWSITQSVGFWPTAVGSLQFEFQNLGGLTTGVAYPLISFRSTGFGTPSSSIFAIAPDLVSAGWAGTFSTTATGVSVTFTSVPEPSGLAIICLPAALFAWAARRRTHNATPGR